MKKNITLFFIAIVFAISITSCSKEEPQLLVIVNCVEEPSIDSDKEVGKLAKNAQVRIYDNFEDWLSLENEVCVGNTNEKGEFLFKNLKSVKYYIHVLYTDSNLNLYTNFPNGVYACSELALGQKSILNISVYPFYEDSDDGEGDETSGNN